MKLLFSCPHIFGKTGPGRVYGILASYLRKQNKYIVDIYNKVIEDQLGLAFDEIASFSGFEVPDVFLGCGQASLLTARELLTKQKVDAYRLSTPIGKMKYVTTWFSSHWGFAEKIIMEEARQLGVQINEPIHKAQIWKCIQEQEMSDKLIVPSEFAKETYEVMPYNKNKVHVVPFGVDSNFYTPMKDKQMNTIVFLFIGGNFLRKGGFRLLEAWHKFDGKDSELQILGANPNVTELWGATHNVRVHGWVPDQEVVNIIRNAHVLVLPSLEEGSALCVYEAMACGLPVIVTPNCGSPIENGKEGFIVQPRNADELLQAMMYFIKQPEEIRRMGSLARQTAEKLTWERFNEGVMKVLEN